MQIVKSALLASLLLLTGACAWSRTVERPLEEGSLDRFKEPLKGGVLEFRLTSYDGRDLKGRVLVGATVDTLMIYRSLLEDSNVELVKLRACGTTEVQGHTEMCWVTGDERDETVTLRKGYWHGTNVDFSLGGKRDPGPDCIDAELVVRALRGRLAATLPIRVVRTDKRPALPDGGAPAPRPPAADAGAP